jgi:hypothetical protein
MKTKTTTLSLCLVLLGACLFTLPSCKKYPDGPSISLRSKSERVANTWKVDTYTINGSDYTSLASGYIQTFSKDGNYSFSMGSVMGSGKWEFQNDEMQIQVTGVSNQSSETLFILKLREHQFWYYYMDGNDRNEFHLVQN